MPSIDPFARQKYLNLETFRRNGEGVRTPVWFVQDGSVLYVTTQASSGKVKRIRRNGQVNVAPCTVDGRVTGAWVPAAARELTGEEDRQRVERLLDRKYGLVKKLFDLRRQRAETTALEITLQEK
jgi:uncharacterized protein